MSTLYKPYSCMDNSRQEVLKVIVVKISAALSIFGSTYILKLVWGKWRKKKSSIDPYQRILVGLSIFDILFSFFYAFLGTWMTPAETGWWSAVGNTKTCTVQGFFLVMGYGTVVRIHNTMLY